MAEELELSQHDDKYGWKTRDIRQLNKAGLETKEQAIQQIAEENPSLRDLVQYHSGKGTDKPEYHLPNETFFDKTMNYLDYVDNIARGVYLGALKKDQTVWQNVKDAAALRKHFSATEIRKLLQKGGIISSDKELQDYQKLMTGEAYNPNTPFTGSNFWRDMAIDMAISPTTWMGGFLPKMFFKTSKGAMAYRAVKGVKGGKKIVDGLSRAQLPFSGAKKKIAGMVIDHYDTLIKNHESSEHLGKWLNRKELTDTFGKISSTDDIIDVLESTKDPITEMVSKKKLANFFGLNKTEAKAMTEIPREVLLDATKHVKRAGVYKDALGGLYGYSMSNPDDPLVERLMNGAMGMMAMHGARRVAPFLSKAVKGTTDGLVDGYYKVARGITEGNLMGSELELKAVFRKQAKELFPMKGGMTRAERMKARNMQDAYVIKHLDSARADMPVSEAYQYYSEGIEKLNNFVEKMQNMYRGTHGKLSERDLIHHRKNLETLTQKTTMYRNQYLKRDLPPQTYNRFMKGHALPESANDIFREATEEANKIVAKVELPELYKTQPKRFLQAAEETRLMNREIVDFYNRQTGNELIGLDFHIDNSHIMTDLADQDELINVLTGKTTRLHVNRGHAYLPDGRLANPFNIPAHYAHSDPKLTEKVLNLKTKLDDKIEDIYKNSDLPTKKKEYLVERTRMAYENEANKMWENVKLTKEGLDNSYKDYSRKFSLSMLDKHERRALQMVRHIEGMKKAKKPIGSVSTVRDKWEGALAGYDALHGYVKGNLLGNSISWVKLNFWDNLTKSYQAQGLWNFMNVAKNQGQAVLPQWFKTDMMRNMKRVLKEKDIYWKGDKYLDRGLEHGVVSKQMFDMHKSGKQVVDDILSNQTLTEDMIANPAKHKGKIKLLAEKLGSAEKNSIGSFRRWMFSLGTYMESAARLTTFKTASKGMMKDGTYEYLKNTFYKGQKNAAKMAEEQVFKLASDLTKETFFDYKNVSKFEEAVMKRLVPFYAFKSKNLKYWLGQMFDPKGYTRLASTGKVVGALGHRMSPNEMEDLPDFMKERTTRRVGYSQRLDKTLASIPYHSFFEGLETLRLDNMRQKASQMSPFIKLPIEWGTGQDIFTGQRFLPTTGTELQKGLEKRIDKTVKEMDFEHTKELGHTGQKYMFGGKGYKLYILQNILRNMDKDWGDLGIRVDKRGNPVAHKDNVVIMDKIFDTIYPMPIIEQMVRIKSEMDTQQKYSPEEMFVKTFTPIAIDKVSKQAIDRQRREVKSDKSRRRKDRLKFLGAKEGEKILKEFNKRK